MKTRTLSHNLFDICVAIYMPLPNSFSFATKTQLHHTLITGKTAAFFKELLEGIFNAALADRTQEGDRFIPPNPNTSYVVKLRNLVNEEIGRN